jgi:very-short-patch-repair endonuclease
MKKLWNNVTKEDVKKAIDLFEKTDENYPKPRNTFLIYKNKTYPAKHIRGLAYMVANNKEISKSEYNGGQETANFFKKLGFSVQYKKDILKQKDKKRKNLKTTIYKEKQKTSSKKLNAGSQKNALQLLLQSEYGKIETEKKFRWLETPNHESLPKEYSSIVRALSKYRNQEGFKKSNYLLPCDIVLEDHKLIVEYDENQHFSEARRITLENYPPKIKLCFSKEAWINSCKIINAKDNSPTDRDERRAFYDAVRDIEAFKNGYKLIRIKHGDFDWETDDAKENLKQIVTAAEKYDKSIAKHKIARLVVTGKHYDENRNPIFSRLKKVIKKFLATEYKQRTYEFILTPGGFLRFNLPIEFKGKFDIKKAEVDSIPIIQKEANRVIVSFFQQLGPTILRKLTETANYFTIGIDGYNPGNGLRNIELVAVYNLKEKKVIHWTGKFYPVGDQERQLIKINNLSTHFIELNNQKIMVLGCHDLNVYSPRGQKKAKSDGWRRKTADAFKKICQKEKPEIILHHPHLTDSLRTWNQSWRNIERELPHVKHFASGINHDRKKKPIRDSINRVLEYTKKGDVKDFFEL